jgi:probable F420-dependent oxidoreductase
MRTLTPELGRVGLWAPQRLWLNSGNHAADAACAIERLGYGTIWIGNGPSTFAIASALLDATSRIVVATGVMNIKVHPVESAAAWAVDAAARYGGRGLLGLGGGFGSVDGGLPGETWHDRLVAYLDRLDTWSPAVPPDSRVLAANGPRMLRLARERSAGAHPFLITPEHTHQARQLLGDGPLLAPEQKVVLESDPAAARRVGRQNLAFYLDKPNYLSPLRRLGFEDEDFRDGGSDRLVDALVARGDETAIVERISEHLQAGADHVALHVLEVDTNPAGHASVLPRETYRRLADAVLR